MDRTMKIIKQGHDGMWVVQEKGWIFWKTISKGFETKDAAKSYVNDLKALYDIEKIFKGEHMI